MCDCWFKYLFKIKVLLCFKSYSFVSSCNSCFAPSFCFISCFIPFSVPRFINTHWAVGSCMSIRDSLATTHNCHLEYNKNTGTCISNVVLNKTNLMIKPYQSSSRMEKKTMYMQHLIIKYLNMRFLKNVYTILKLITILRFLVLDQTDCINRNDDQLRAN